MFSQFTTRGNKALIVRAVDIRIFQDTDEGMCTLSYEPASGELYHIAILGTAEPIQRGKRSMRMVNP